jgi:hypothetical protein
MGAVHLTCTIKCIQDALCQRENDAPTGVHGRCIIPAMEISLLPITEHQREAGRRLRAVIDASRISYVEAAKVMGISKSNLGNWMRGDAPIGTYQLYLLCRVTGATADWVLLGDPSGLPQRLAQPLLQPELSPQSAE